jgi:undecaprenyl diphosphate synthase
MSTKSPTESILGMFQTTALEEISIPSFQAPRHVAIIMDGNRRWAYKQLQTAAFGHSQGALVVDKIVQIALSKEIKVLTLYAFSTENWKRSPFEVDTIFSILKNQLLKMKKKMVEQGVRFSVIGNVNLLPKNLKDLINEVVIDTAACNRLDLVMALNYGARDELTRAFKKLATDFKDGKFDLEDVDEKKVESYLDTHLLPDPDLIIRTSGENRISNFLLWQSAYSELYFTDVLWPDFTEEEFEKALLEYGKRARRKGK